MPIQPFQIAPAPIDQGAQVSDPTPPANSGTFYTKNVGGKIEGFYTNTTGDTVQLTDNGQLAGGGGIAVFEKMMKNTDTNPMPIGMPVSITSTGSIVPGDSDSADGQQPVGITLETIAVGEFGKVALYGRNIAGILTGMGFIPGDDVFLGETGGNFISDPTNDLTGGNDSIIKMGVAAAPDGQVGASATDLILIRQVISNP